MYFAITKSEYWKSIFVSLFHLSDMEVSKWTDTWPILGRYLTDTRPILGQHLTDSWPAVDRYKSADASADSRPTDRGTIGRQSTDCRPTIGRLSTGYRPIVGRQSTDIAVDIAADTSTEATYSTYSRLGQFWKIYKTLVQLILNSTRPHVITYSNSRDSQEASQDNHKSLACDCLLWVLWKSWGLPQDSTKSTKLDALVQSADVIFCEQLKTV